MTAPARLIVFVPLMAPALFLMGIGPLARWKQANLPEIGVRLKWAFGVSLITALVFPLALGKWSGLAAFGLWLALWIFAATLVNLWSRVRPLPDGDEQREVLFCHQVIARIDLRQAEVIDVTA